MPPRLRLGNEQPGGPESLRMVRLEAEIGGDQARNYQYGKEPTFAPVEDAQDLQDADIPDG